MAGLRISNQKVSPIMDALQKLLFPRANVRGETVVLGDSLEAAVVNQNLPLAARRLAGEMAAAAVLAAGALQFQGTVALQIEGDGPIRRALAEVRQGYAYRVMVEVAANVDPASIDPNAKMKDLVNVSGRGRCAFILDRANRPADEAPYQGVVALEGESLADALEAYFRDSEQVDTKLMLAADEKAAGGVFLQKLPSEGGKLPEDYDPEGWRRLEMFASTVKSEELLTLSPEEINRRLFWEESPLVTHEAEPHFACTCSQTRFDDIVRSLGREEAEAIVKEKGAIDIACRFCGAKAHYDAIDAAALFTPSGVTHEA